MVLLAPVTLSVTAVGLSPGLAAPSLRAQESVG